MSAVNAKPPLPTVSGASTSTLRMIGLCRETKACRSMRGTSSEPEALVTTINPTPTAVLTRLQSGRSNRGHLFLAQICIEGHGLLLAELQLHQLVTVTHAAQIRAAHIADGGGKQCSIFPGHIHFVTTPGPQALDRTVRPGFRQRGEQFDFPGLRLQQHLADARHPAEVAVDLKRRMRIK